MTKVINIIGAKTATMSNSGGFMNHNKDQCRAEFEKWAATLGYNTAPPIDSLLNQAICMSWQAYQAAWNARQQEVDRLIASNKRFAEALMSATEVLSNEGYATLATQIANILAREQALNVT